MRTAKLQGRLADRAKARQSTGVVLPAVKKGMIEEFGLDTSRRWDIVHPSELSHQDRFCPRAVYMRIVEGPLAPEKFDWVRENIFAEGNNIHEKWQARLRSYTELWGDWKCVVCGRVERSSIDPARDAYWDDEFCYSIASTSYPHIWQYQEVTLNAEAEALLVGHADGAFGTSLVEFKSVGEGTVRIEAPTLYKRHTTDSGTDLKGLWQDIKRPFRTHLNQGDIYLWICAQRGLPFNQISYVYESKWNQLVKEFVVEYDEARSVLLVAQAQAVMYALEYKTSPDCKYPGKCPECKPYDNRRASAPKKRTVQD